MTEFKGTPGPYRVIYGGFVGDDGFSIGSVNASASRIKLICECWPPTIVDQEHREELAANECLLSAAPDLLAACQLFVAAYTKSHQLEKTDVAVRAATAAIANALGESP